MKKKGIAAERELIHFFWSHDIAAIRVAGSGSSKYPCPDIIIGTPSLTWAVEVKVTKEKTFYFKKEDMDQLIEYSKKMGFSPLLALKIERKWKLFDQKQLDAQKKSEKFYVIPGNSIGYTSLDQAKKIFFK